MTRNILDGFSKQCLKKFHIQLKVLRIFFYDQNIYEWDK